MNFFCQPIISPEMKNAEQCLQIYLAVPSTVTTVVNSVIIRPPSQGIVAKLKYVLRCEISFLQSEFREKSFADWKGSTSLILKMSYKIQNDHLKIQFLEI